MKKFLTGKEWEFKKLTVQTHDSHKISQLKTSALTNLEPNEIKILELN